MNLTSLIILGSIFFISIVFVIIAIFSCIVPFTEKISSITISDYYYGEFRAISFLTGMLLGFGLSSLCGILHQFSAFKDTVEGEIEMIDPLQEIENGGGGGWQKRWGKIGSGKKEFKGFGFLKQIVFIIGVIGIIVCLGFLLHTFNEIKNDPNNTKTSLVKEPVGYIIFVIFAGLLLADIGFMAYDIVKKHRSALPMLIGFLIVLMVIVGVYVTIYVIVILNIYGKDAKDYSKELEKFEWILWAIMGLLIGVVVSNLLQWFIIDLFSKGEIEGDIIIFHFYSILFSLFMIVLFVVITDFNRVVLKLGGWKFGVPLFLAILGFVLLAGSIALIFFLP